MSTNVNKLTQRQLDPEMAVQEAEAVEQALEIIDNTPAETLPATLAASDLPKSAVRTALSRRVRTAYTSKEKYKYPMNDIVSPMMTFDGAVDENYTEMLTVEGQAAYGNTTFSAAFDKSNNKAVRFTYLADTEFNRKTSILKDELMDFKTNPQDAIANIFKSTENITKDMGIFQSEQSWDIFADRLVTIEADTAPAIGDKTDDIMIAQKGYQTLLELGANKKDHIGTGSDTATPGVITDGTNSVSPTLRFNSSEFYVWATPKHMTNIEFDGNRTFFNWGGKKLPVKGVKTLHVGEEGMSTAAVTALDGVELVFQHEGAIKGVQNWKGTGIASTGQMEDNFHAYISQDMYPKYDAPIIGIKAAAAPAK